MKPYERRAANAYPYYRLANWDARNCCWAEGKGVYETHESAKAAAKTKGRWRISEIGDGVPRKDLAEFER